MLYTEFDAFVPEDRREIARPLFPKDLRKEIEEMNEWVYDTVNSGVYEVVGFAMTQAAYEEHLHALFASLDRLEKNWSSQVTRLFSSGSISPKQILGFSRL